MKAIGPNIIPQVGNIYIHIETGNKYVVLGVGKMKHPERGHWVPSVVYKRTSTDINVSSDEVYTRELHSFQIHFADADGIVEV